MSLVEIADDAGKTVTFVKMDDGRILPPFDIDVMQNVPSLRLRENDVLMCAYAKSGTHWLFEICRMLTLKTTECPAMRKQDFMIEYTPQNIIDDASSPRILNTHFKYCDLPTDLHVKKPRIIYIRRNPKDVAVSLYNHTRKIERYKYFGEFKDFLKLFVDSKVMYGSWFDYVKEWELICRNTDIPVLDLTYEEMKRDSVGGIRQISDFLGLERDEDLILRVSEQCSFASMVKRNGHLMGMVNGKSIMFRKGEVGDWKNWFTVAQDEWFNEKYSENMKGSDLEFIYHLK